MIPVMAFAGTPLSLKYDSLTGATTDIPSGLTHLNFPAGFQLQINGVAVGGLTLSGATTDHVITAASATTIHDSGTALSSLQPLINFAAGKIVHVSKATAATDTRGSYSKYDLTVPFATIAAAISASASGDVIQVGPGTYSETTAHFVLPSGVSMIGSGMDVTIISSTAITSPILQAGTNSLIRDLTVSATLTDGTFQYPIGVSGSSVTGVTLINVKTTGDTDGLYVAGDDTSGTVFLRAFNCNFTSKFDAINVTRGGVAFYDCIAVATGPSSTVSGIATAVCASGVTAHPPRIYWHGGSVSASGAGGSGVNSAFELRGGSLSGGLIEIHNPKVHLGTDGLNNYDLNNASSGASTINYNNVTRDDGAALTINGTTVTNISRSQPLDAALTALAGGSDFVQFTGPTSSTKVKTLRDAADTILELGGSYTPSGTWTNMTLVNPALGTPASGNASNLTSLTASNITGSTTAGRNILSLTNPSAISFVKIAADNSVSTRTPAQVLSDIGAQASGSYAASGANSDITALSGLTGAIATPTRITLATGTITDPTTGIALSQTWNDASDVFKAMTITITDTASAGTAKFVDYLVGVTTMFNIEKSGIVNVNASGAINVGTNTRIIDGRVYNASGSIYFGSNGAGNAVILDGVTNTFTGSLIMTPQALSGAGAVNVTTSSTAYTSTGASQALTLANGSVGQIKTICHVVDGGSGILTPTTKAGYSTITFTNAGDSVTLQYHTTAGWCVIGSYGVTIAP